MKFIFEYHNDGLPITPLISLARGECDNPQCRAEHLMISVGWLFWTVGFVFEFGGNEP